MPKPFVFDCAWVFPVPREQLWARLGRTEQYTQWWPWLVRCEVEGLQEGATAECLVRPPLPYRLQFEIWLHTVVPGRQVAGTVRGDLEGEATLELSDAAQGSRAHLAWEVRLANPMLRALSTVARPAMLWGHDRIVTWGLEQFSARALDTDAPDTASA